MEDPMTAPATARWREPAGTDATRQALRTLADTLTGHAFDIRSPVWEHAQTLAITNARGVLCDVSLYGDGRAAFECLPCPGALTSPAHTVSKVLRILGAGTRDPGTVLLTPHQGLTFKGTVGRTLAAYGMSARLDLILRDEVNYDIYAVVEVANPAQPGRGKVRVADDGSLRWECALRDPVTAVGLGPAEIAGIIAGALAGHRA
jgi:hypothetical protein